MDVGVLQARALAHLLDTAAISMGSLEIQAGAGTYAIAYTGDHPLLAPFRSNRSIIYVGKGLLAERCASHALSLCEAQGLAVADFSVRAVPYTCHVEAELAERLLIDALRPVWNAPAFAGFGSRPQGAGRQAHQRASSWDTLFPGRSGRAQPTGEADAVRRPHLQAAHLSYPAVLWPGR
jgi:Eco29kI restriction endonuclease